MRTYRASSLGSCTRAQIALQLGMAEIGTSDKMQALYDRGNAHEVECLAAMEADGWHLESAWNDIARDDGQFYVELEVAGAVITGHLDGIACPDQSPYHRRVLEIKSPISWAKWERAHKTGDYSDPLMNRYAWQISVYMVATGLEAVVACVEDGQVRTFGIEVPPFSLEDIAIRVESMEVCCRNPVDPAQLLCDQVDFPCPVAYLHDRAEVVEDEVLDGYLHKYAKYTLKKKQIEADLKAARDAIDAHLGIDDTRTTAAGTVTRYTTTRTTYDTKAAIADGIDLTAYAKTSTSTSVRVTPRSPEPTIDGDPTGA
jgi:hypothetical protein